MRCHVPNLGTQQPASLQFSTASDTDALQSASAYFSFNQIENIAHFVQAQEKCHAEKDHAANDNCAK